MNNTMNKSTCSKCRKEEFCLPMGEKSANICHGCFKETMSDESFAQFTKKYGLDIENLTGEKVSEMLIKAIAIMLAKAQLFGIKVRKIEMADLTDDIGAVKAEIDATEFDTEFLPKLRTAATGDLPDHVKAAVDALGSTVGRFNA